MKYNKILSVLLALCVIFSFAVPMASAAVCTVTVTANGISEGNICNQNDDISYTVVYSNYGNVALSSLTATLTLTNETLGETVDTLTDTVTIDAHARVSKTYSLDFNDLSFGELKLAVALSNGTTAECEIARVYSPDSLNYNVGFNVNHGFEWKDATWTNETAENIIDACKKAGIGYIRDGVEWQVAETAAGKNQLPDDAVAFYKKITDAGIKVMYNVLYGNTNYFGTAHTDMPTDETGRAAFAEFCKNVATQLDGMVYDYAIWNEPDADYANTNSASGSDYAALLQEAYTAIKGVNPSNNVIGLMVSGKIRESGLLESATFEEKAIDAGALNYLDAAAFTTYFNDKQPYETFDEYVDDSKSYIGATKSLWASEMGANTYVNTEAESAAKLAKLIPMQKENGNLDKMFIYALMDKASGADGAELHFGQIRADGTAKPAFASITFANSIVGTATSTGMTSSSSNRIYNYTSADGDKISAVWTTSGTSSYAVSFDAESGKKIYAYDMYGNLLSTTDSNSVSVTSSLEPQYLVYSATKPVDGVGTSAGGDVTEITETCNITAKDGVVTISGTTKERYVSAYAFADGKSILESVDMEQLTVDEDGAFSGTITVPDEGIYAVKVSAGLTAENLISKQDFSAIFDFYADGVKVKDLTALKTAASANSKIEVNVIDADDAVIGIVAVYDGKSLNSVTNDDNTEGGIVLDGIDMSASKEIKMMLWNSFSGLIPYIKAIKLK